MVTAQNKFVRNRPVLTTALLSQKRASTCYSLLRRRRIHLHSPHKTPPCDNTTKVSFLILFAPPLIVDLPLKLGVQMLETRDGANLPCPSTVIPMNFKMVGDH